MSRVSRDEFEKYYLSDVFYRAGWNFGILCGMFLEAVIEMADESGYIEDFSQKKIYDAIVDCLDDESQRGRYGFFAAVSIMGAIMECSTLGYIELIPNGEDPSAHLCIPNKEEK